MKAKVLTNLNHDGKEYKPGTTFTGSDEVVQPLIDAGVLRDPATVEKEEVDTTEADAARAAVKAIVDTANSEAARVAEASQEEAKTLLSTAKGEAEKIVADAKAEAVKITKVAQEAAKAAKPADNKPN